jgi:hypothetical protein
VAIRTMDDFLSSVNRRLVAVERRLAIRPSGGSSGPVFTEAFQSYSYVIGGTTGTGYLSRSGRIAHFYTSVVPGSAVNFVPNGALINFPAGWTPTRLEYFQIPRGSAPQILGVSTTNGGSIISGGTYSPGLTAGERLTVNVTYELAAGMIP